MRCSRPEMGEDDIKTDHGIAIEAFISAQHDPYKSGIMSAPEMTETPIRGNAAPELTPGNTAGDEHGISKASRGSKPYSRTTILKLVSTNATSSAFPESFGLTLSVTGRWLSAYSSSALYLISTQHLPTYKNTSRAFRIRRKPLAVAISDTGRFAVLTTSHKVDVYQCEHGDLLSGGCKKLETIHLDNEAKTLAFSTCGEIVAAGSDVGLEIKNLGPDSRETDRRYITCSAADRLMFSKDSRALLATSVVKKSRFSTFISLTESFEDAFMEEVVEQPPLGKLWITQLLFPERVQARQAVLLPNTGSELVNTELLAFDSHLDQFKIYDVTLKRFTNRELGTPEEVVWTRHHKPEEAVPAITADASSIAVAVRSKTDKEIWVYHVPQSWWEPEPTSSPESESSYTANNSLEAAEKIKLPGVSEGAPPESITNLQWVQTQDAEVDRLVALVSTVNVAVPEDVVPIEAPAASGKLFLFDFTNNARGDDEEISTIVVDLGELTATEGLMDEVLELDREVDLVRRRTQIQRNRPPAIPLPSPRGSLRRSVSSGSTSGGVPTLRGLEHSNSGRSARRRRSFSSLSTNEERDEVVAPAVPVDEPYSQTQPRSQFSLHRAATIAANAPANRQHLRALPDQPLEYRRADGLREMPHESDADNWVPPPPVYSARPDNVVSHPITSNPRAAAAYVPQPPRAPSLTRNRLSRPLSGLPPVPALSQSTRMQYSSSPQGPTVLPQQAVSTTIPAPSQPMRAPRSAASVPSLTRPIPNASHAQQGPQNSPIRSRLSNHRNADSLSSTSSRSSLNPLASQPAQQTSNATTNTNTMGPGPAMALVTQGLPPNMTPPSPIAEFVRPTARRADTPTPTSPTNDQLASLHRRSGSGESFGPRPSSRVNTNSSPRRVASADLLGTSPNGPVVTRPSQRPSQENGRSSPRNQQHRPSLGRLATIASITDHQRHDEFMVEPMMLNASANTAPPETPTSKRQWWKISTPKQSHRPELKPPSRPQSRLMHNLTDDTPGYVATITGPTKSKEKQGGSKCVVM